MAIELASGGEQDILRPRIMVVGIGGGGCNAVNNMIETGLQGIEFLAANTDSQALSSCKAQRKLQLGSETTSGLGSGAKPEVGRRAAQESMDDIRSALEGCNMLFIAAGMGGGTGTGAAPVFAEVATDMGILTIGVITKPFEFEGSRRMDSALAGIEDLQKFVGTLMIIPNQNLFRLANEKTTFMDSFKMADGVLCSGVRSITDLILIEGLINLDFADIRTVMSEMGKAVMGMGEAEGDNRSLRAAEAAITNPLLEDTNLCGAQEVMVNITAGHDLLMHEVDDAVNRIRSEAGGDAHIHFGAALDESMHGVIRVSIVATGISGGSQQRLELDGHLDSVVGAEVESAVEDTIEDSGIEPIIEPEVAIESRVESSIEDTIEPIIEPEPEVKPEPEVGIGLGSDLGDSVVSDGSSFVMGDFGLSVVSDEDEDEEEEQEQEVEGDNSLAAVGVESGGEVESESESDSEPEPEGDSDSGGNISRFSRWRDKGSEGSEDVVDLNSRRYMPEDEGVEDDSDSDDVEDDDSNLLRIPAFLRR